MKQRQNPIKKWLMNPKKRRKRKTRKTKNKSKSLKCRRRK